MRESPPDYYPVDPFLIGMKLIKTELVAGDQVDDDTRADA
jgi:hypothetical protein